jgi:hypothetical protein
MTSQPCEYESSVVAASRSGVCSDDLARHIIACEICAETKRIAGLFQHAAKAPAQSQPPSANLVWQKVQAQTKQLALKRATRCMAWMWAAAAVYAVVLTAWSLPQLWHMEPSHFSTALSTLSNGMVLAGVVTAVVAVVLGSCCLVLLGSRTTFRLHT